ncbi:MAG TPA: hypothetical protein VKF38_15305 [Anaerolineaceae bacterium]|nr:hypothetical protein [Anaerolineaceae bacterium]
MLSTTRKVLGTIVAILFIIVSVPVPFVFPAERILFQPEPYIRAIQNQNVYQDIPGWLAGAAVNNGINGLGITQSGISASLGQQDYQKIFSLLMPQEWIKSQTENIITNFWDYFNFKQNALNLDIDLREIKTQFNGAQGQEISKEIISSWPPCSMQQLLAILAQTAQGGSLANITTLCQPPKMYLPLADQFVQMTLSGVASALPDQLNLLSLTGEGATGDPTQTASWQQTFQTYKLIRWGLRLSPVLSIILLLFLAIITFRSTRTGLSWMGITILLSGILGLVTAGILFLSGDWLIQQIVTAVLIGFPAGLTNALINMIKEVADRFYLWGAAIALMAAILGLILFLVSRLYKDPLRSYP